ncbi:2OG-Fe(II) oxygenase [Singulisphaera sp. PoT]|uniref:2OG-Fe(II) oxygenase n=1 Tax=Singulisphaera sp. PoT TaxID=3411797 RepID=UPI003BF47F5F
MARWRDDYDDDEADDLEELEGSDEQAELKSEIDAALRKVDRPGNYCASGSLPAVLPGLEVEGLGPVGLPLTAKQAKELIKHCKQAPYGKGEETIVDTKVRRVWKLDPASFRLKNPDWPRLVRAAVELVQEKLGLEKQALESHLYDLLVYEAGGFFLPHRDGEKLDRMVATLVIALPSPHEGGELVIRHDGQEEVIDFGSDQSAFQIQYAAFYADCEHEVRPLRKGYRLCLVYNLTLAKPLSKAKSRAKEGISAPRPSGHIDKVAALLEEWQKQSKHEKLAVTLDHQYTQEGLAWDALKGLDRGKAQVLLQAAEKSGNVAYLALLTLWESGSAEDYYGGYYGSRYGRRTDYEEPEPGEYEMEEIFDRSLTADHWRLPDGEALPIGELDVEWGEVVGLASLKSHKPSKEEFEGYTGNAGMTLERWYQHAAIIIWPEARHFDIICQRGGRNAVPALDLLVKRWKAATPKTKEADALKKQCVKLATRIINTWTPATRRFSYYEPERKVAEGNKDMLPALAAIDEPKLIGKFLANVVAKDGDIEPAESLLALCQQYGWGTFRDELAEVAKQTTNDTLTRNVGLLERLCNAKPRKREGWPEACASFAKALVEALGPLDKKRAAGEWGFRKEDRAATLISLIQSLVIAGQGTLLSNFVEHVLATPKVYPLSTVVVPALEALQPWFKKNVKTPDKALTHWVASCRRELEDLTSKEPEEPKDFRRKVPVTCKCEHCAELKLFLKDPKESVHSFRIRQEIRNHLESEIRNTKCDLTCHTDRRGSPQTLVCTKNTASYQEALKTYHQNLERLKVVSRVEKALPS